MPPGAKKRKALKKKQRQQQQESNGTSTNTKGSNGDNLHEKENGSQDGRESDDNESSSPDYSQGNGEFGTKVPSAAISFSLLNDTVAEMSDAIAVERGMDDKKHIVEKLPNPSENSTQASKNIACQDASVKETAPVVDSVSTVVIPERSEHPETSTHSDLVNKKSDEKKEYPSTGLEKDNGNVVTLPGSAAGTSHKVESVRESEAPVSPEEKRLLFPGPPAVRTPWLSCCGLFDAVTGSDR